MNVSSASAKSPGTLFVEQMRSRMNATKVAERKQMNDIKMAFGSQESFSRNSNSNEDGTFLMEQ